MKIVVVLSPDKPQLQVRDQWNKGGKIQRHSQQCSTVNVVTSLSMGDHTPRAMFLRAVIVFFCCALDKDWDLKEEMQRWGVGEDGIGTLTGVHENASRVAADAWGGRATKS